jgi:hypothetical protein
MKWRVLLRYRGVIPESRSRSGADRRNSRGIGVPAVARGVLTQPSV